MRLATTMLLLTLPTTIAAQAPADELASYHRAREVTRAGMDALGGDSAWSGLTGLLVRFEGDLVHRHQSHRVEPPYDRTPLTGWVAYDNAGGRFALDQAYSYPGGFAGRLRVITDGRAAYRLDMMRRAAEPMPSAGAAQFQFFVDRMPQAIVQRALERRATLRYAGRRNVAGRPHDVVTFATPQGGLAAMSFDAESHLLTRFESLRPDVTEGEAMYAESFAHYRPLEAASGRRLMVPARRMVTLAEEPIAEMTYSASAGPVPDSLFALPSGVAIDTVVASPRAITPRTLAPGVHAIHGVAGNTVLAVEFTDHLMVIEPPGSDATSRAVLDTLGRLAPGKPVRYIVPTHFHDDHAGGVRAYMDAGATVVTTPSYVSFFQRVARRASTLGAPERPLANPKIETVENGRRVFEDATRRLELIDIGRNPHTDEMLVAWLPNERIMFQGDLWNPQWGTIGERRGGNATTEYFVDWLRESGLEPEVVAGVHGPVQTREELEAAVEHRRP